MQPAVLEMVMNGGNKFMGTHTHTQPVVHAYCGKTPLPSGSVGWRWWRLADDDVRWREEDQTEGQSTAKMGDGTERIISPYSMFAFLDNTY